MTIASFNNNLREYLESFSLVQGQVEQIALFDSTKRRTEVEFFAVEGRKYSRFVNEYWTAKQRQANSIHEVAYRACFKPQLPRFFIELFTGIGDVVYDPFGGRGTTAIEAALLRRRVISNDINPLSEILASPRLLVPTIDDVQNRLKSVDYDEFATAERDISMFFHSKTEAEIVSLKHYLKHKRNLREEDFIDRWIRMVATNRLTGHSPGFFSVYTLPPNQAVSAESQRKINEKRNQSPPYRDTKRIILKKSGQLLQDISEQLRRCLHESARNARFLNCDARYTREIETESVKLTVTSPPFLDTVQYTDDNWLRFWFNEIDGDSISRRITMSRTLLEWSETMGQVFKELYRITKPGGWVAFEVGEVKGGKVLLEETVVPLGLNAGFTCEGVLVNLQEFTKTANIWGISNNSKGTNSNRVVLFCKD